MFADMHTHSEYSHDSVCRIEDMLQAQLEQGTAIFAVTDHCDVDSYAAYDVFTPIQAAYDTVLQLRETCGDRILPLAGVEISEGFWHPQQCEKIHDLCPYDVIIGSVHLVQYRELTYAYSKIDFSALGMETIREYMDAYFNDVLTMIDTMDFDILAHLTCPLRYITGKYGIPFDLAPYEEKIGMILKKIIEKGIALEVNASYSGAPGSFMPSNDILKKYRELGGKLITLGSDAHVPQNASRNLAQAYETVRALGFETVYFYKDRRPFPVEAPVDRVRRMEALFDDLSANPDPVKYRILCDYMDSGLWQMDYARDERGEFPKDLKRGVLSEDGLYNLLCDLEQTIPEPEETI